MVAIVLVGLVVSCLGGALAYFAPALALAYRATGRTAAVSLPHPAGRASSAATATTVGDRAFTVLLLGSDDDQKFANANGGKTIVTQSMILVRVDPVTRRAVMLSIPRDLWIQLPNGAYGKADQASEFGGPPGATAAVEQAFDIKIDAWVWVGLTGLIRLIDYMGGVDVVTSQPVMDDYYPADIDSKDPYAYERVAVLPGPQHLNGHDALQYVRSRHGDLQGDFGRSERQQQVLMALKAKARYIKPEDLPNLASTFNGELQTSMSLTQIRGLLPLAQAFDNPDQIQHLVLLPPYTTSRTIDGQDALVGNWSLILPLVHQYFGYA